MSIERLFDHTCDIYHLTQTDESPGYNLPPAPKDSYPLTADISAVPCHFNIKGDSPKLIQNEPENSLTERTKLNLPVGTDIRINDRVVDTTVGLAFTVVSAPRNIRGNHIIVYVERTREQRPI